MVKASLRSAVNAKCRGCGGIDGGRHTWRLHVSVCPVVSCPLWSVRPLATRNVPAWLASRHPSDLPEGFLSLTIEEAIRRIRVVRGLLPCQMTCNSEGDTCSERIIGAKE